MENVLFTVFDVFNFGLVVFLWWITFKNYNDLPQRIPVHFDLDGKADRFGNKAYSFLMPVLGILMFAMFVYITGHPEGANFPVEITAQNEKAQYLIMKIVLRVLFALIMILFLNNQDYMFRYTLDENAKPRISMATVIICAIGFVPAIFLITHLFK
ncbi:DUF1648 domain-containing protein [Chryseobacterium sp. NRRL B-14859]|uniref:DUF1648 domain-containing protein n=1 Tax=unclassified Chryseobacterium TaxID=2593645 RepID=UPI000F44E3C7|nr:DUF1648 domain-containing protein [Chryseobacterium sp. G0240]ROI01084.1 DUF1648 domain-containing protein [Chryseobacterium sp. G0240]